MTNEDALYWNKKGDKFYFKKNYEEAIKCYEKATQLNSDDAFVFKNCGDALIELATKRKDEALYWRAFEKYKEATEKNPYYASAFSSWGYALAELAEIKQDETLYCEAFEKFNKATEKDPNDAFTFGSWGYALAELAEIKQDETLYCEAFEKFNEATEKDPNDAFVFVFWGNALVELAAIKQDETLYYKALDKFNNATEKNPNDAFAFKSWGDALAELASIKHDETLYCEAFEKYKKAAEINQKDAFMLVSWGNALIELAEIKQDVTLYQKAIEKYKKVVQLESDNSTSFNNWGYAIVDLAEIIQNENVIKILFKELYQKSGRLKKLKKDILEICIIFSNKRMKEIINDKKLFFPLLEIDSENYDSVFFKEITKEITNTKELNKYKRAYILSVLIISQLYINDENEKSVAYYTKKSASQEMLFNDKAFRLNAINYSNDPTEGKILLDYLFGEGKYPEKVFNTGYGAFAGCFTFNHDSLNQFRLYGKENDREGTGLSLVFKPTFFSEKAKMAMKQDNISVEDKQHALFRCIYIDPVTRRVETVGHKEAYLFYRENNGVNQNKDIEEEINKYRNYIAGIIENVKQEMQELIKIVDKLEPEIIGRLLINLRYLTKHIAFKEEQECRIIKILSLKNNKEVKINPTPDEDNIQIDSIKQLYIDYQNITGKIEKIYFGPNADKIELFQDLLRYKSHNIACEKSKNPLSP
jgi:tetratricopeptide (TPR) repeat protein